MMKNALFIFSVLILINGCGNPAKNKINAPDVVVERVMSDPKGLNYALTADALTTYLSFLLSPTPYMTDFKTLEQIPFLAESLPVVEVKDDGKVFISYRLRDEAKWDNGDDITALDIEFSVKMIKNPAVNAFHVRPYYELLENMIIDPNDLKKVVCVFSEPYFLAEIIAGDMHVYPRYVYDPEGLMNDFTLMDLTYKKDELAENEKIKAFGDFINDEKFQREIVVSCGAYNFEKWITNERIILTKKENWWGDKFADLASVFEAYPKKIVYEIIQDENTALTALKSGKIDVMANISPQAFVEELPKSEKFIQNFNTLTPELMMYEYIGMNLKNDILSDRNVRLALSHLANVERMINVSSYGLASPSYTFIHPAQKDFHNSAIKAYPFSIEKAKEILLNDGWTDSNGDGILDKVIKGKKRDLKFTFYYNVENTRREAIAMIFKDEAKKAGVEIELQALVWPEFLDKLRNNQFEMFTSGWITSILENDPKQVWHSSSNNGGSNYVSFGTPESDELIEKLRVEMDRNKRATYYKRLQEIVHEEIPYIFIQNLKERIAVSKKFDNVYGTPARPGYWVGGFKALDLQ